MTWDFKAKNKRKQKKIYSTKTVDFLYFVTFLASRNALLCATTKLFKQKTTLFRSGFYILFSYYSCSEDSEFACSDSSLSISSL